MPIPKNTLVFEETMDPSDLIDFVIDCAPLLESGEDVASYALTLPAESLLLGLTLETTNPYQTELVNKKLRFWTSIALDKRANTIFDNDGTVLPIEVSITTNSIPPRRRQRTVGIKVVQR